MKEKEKQKSFFREFQNRIAIFQELEGQFHLYSILTVNAVIKVSFFFTAFFHFPKADLKSKIDFEKKV